MVDLKGTVQLLGSKNESQERIFSLEGELRNLEEGGQVPEEGSPNYGKYQEVKREITELEHYCGSIKRMGSIVSR